MKDIIGRELSIGDWVVFSRPMKRGGGLSSVDIGTITKYNPRTSYISIALLLPQNYDWSSKVIATKFSPSKFYRVDNQL